MRPSLRYFKSLSFSGKKQRTHNFDNCKEEEQLTLPRGLRNANTAVGFASVLFFLYKTGKTITVGKAESRMKRKRKVKRF